MGTDDGEETVFFLENLPPHYRKNSMNIPLLSLLQIGDGRFVRKIFPVQNLPLDPTIGGHRRDHGLEVRGNGQWRPCLLGTRYQVKARHEYKKNCLFIMAARGSASKVSIIDS